MLKKPIIFIDQYSGLSGGQKVLLNIVSHLTKSEYACTVILPEKGQLTKEFEKISVKCQYLPMGYYSIGRKNIIETIVYLLRLPILTIMLYNIIRKTKASLVYANGARSFSWATLACSFSKTPLIWHLHSIFSKGINKTTCNIFAKFVCVKKIVAVSKETAAVFEKFPHKTEVIYNGVEIPVTPPRNNLLRETYSLPKTDVLVGTIGILEEWKNQEDLIRAAKLLTEREKLPVKFFIIGESLYNKPKQQWYKEKLKKIQLELGLKNKVIFTGFRRDIVEIMGSLDMLVICSKEPDPCPMVSLEAGSLGLAIISSNLGGVKEMFEENTEVVFYTPGNPEALSEKLSSLIKNCSLMHKLGDTLRLKITKEYTAASFLNKISRVITENIQ